jgi:hypothetical protein
MSLRVFDPEWPFGEEAVTKAISRVVSNARAAGNVFKAEEDSPETGNINVRRSIISPYHCL